MKDYRMLGGMRNAKRRNGDGNLRARGRRGLPCDELYRQLFNPALFLKAWGRIYANTAETLLR